MSYRHRHPALDLVLESVLDPGSDPALVLDLESVLVSVY